LLTWLIRSKGVCPLLASEADASLINTTSESDIEWLTGVRNIRGEMEVRVPLAGIIDKDAESARLNKEIEKIKKDFARVEGQT